VPGIHAAVQEQVKDSQLMPASAMTAHLDQNNRSYCIHRGNSKRTAIHRCATASTNSRQVTGIVPADVVEQHSHSREARRESKSTMAIDAESPRSAPASAQPFLSREEKNRPCDSPWAIEVSCKDWRLHKHVSVPSRRSTARRAGRWRSRVASRLSESCAAPLSAGGKLPEGSAFAGRGSWTSKVW